MARWALFGAVLDPSCTTFVSGFYKEITLGHNYRINYETIASLYSYSVPYMGHELYSRIELCQIEDI